MEPSLCISLASLFTTLCSFSVKRNCFFIYTHILVYALEKCYIFPLIARPPIPRTITSFLRAKSAAGLFRLLRFCYLSFGHRKSFFFKGSISREKLVLAFSTPCRIRQCSLNEEHTRTRSKEKLKRRCCSFGETKSKNEQLSTFIESTCAACCC